MRWKKISDIIHSPISGEWGDEGDGIKVLRTTNFTNEGKLDLENVVSRNVDQKKIEKKRLKYGDTIIEKSGGSPSQPVGRVVYFDILNDKYICNNFTSVLRLKAENFDARYFFWFLFSQHQTKSTLKFQNKTTGIINLQLTRYLEESKIREYPLPTQQHIAAVLDKADALRQQNQQLLTYYDELLQGTFIELFGDPVTNEKGWEVKKLHELCSEIVDCPHSTPNHDIIPTEYPSIRTTELKNGSIDWSSMKYVQHSEYVIRTKRLAPIAGDIVYGREGTFGEAVIIPKATKMCLGQRVMLLRPDYTLCNSIFLLAMVRHEYVYNQAVRKTSGSTVGHVNVKDVKQFDVLLPPLAIQNQFAEIVESIEAQKAQAQAALTDSEALFQGLLAGYFGENQIEIKGSNPGPPTSQLRLF